ncbi:MAG TPA: hypothetical protein VI544_02430 [Candidatus Nanoarchaeia archaeon]|nr:hypothetical protein [Candidatus Nanoarchaeia archaeon]
MESFLKRVLAGKSDADSHRYFMRFGKGDYKRRFLIRLNRGEKIKVKTSFEFANDLVKFVNENKNVKFSGKVLTKDKVSGKEGKKKAGVFIYEVSECSLNEFENAYYYLLDVSDSEIVLKIKKSLPKPGKNEEKIDEGFCSLLVDKRYWPALKETFFWDIPECKKASIEHELKISDIVLPKGEKDPVKVRELAKRKGIIIREMEIDGKKSSKEIAVEA